MLEQFEKLDNAITSLEKIIEDLKSQNSALRRERDELKSIVDDRDLEIMQLQEDAKNRIAAEESEKTDITGRLESLLSRIGTLSADDKQDAGGPKLA